MSSVFGATKKAMNDSPSTSLREDSKTVAFTKCISSRSCLRSHAEMECIEQVTKQEQQSCPPTLVVELSNLETTRCEERAGSNKQVMQCRERNTDEESLQEEIIQFATSDDNSLDSEQLDWIGGIHDSLHGKHAQNASFRKKKFDLGGQSFNTDKGDETLSSFCGEDSVAVVEIEANE